MKTQWIRALIALGVMAVLAVPSAALARDGGGGHGADDQTRTTAGQTVSGEAESGSHNEAEPESADDHGTDSTHAQEHATHEAAPNAGGPVRTERYELRGTVASVDASAGTITVAVKKANHGRRGARLRRQTVVFDVSSARIVVRDVNGDGTRDLNDVAQDDSVRVQADLPRKGTIDLTQPVAARAVQDRGSR